ncbi:hypothetical protein ACIRTB_05310 [Streptomyces sp. NPDC101158]|uniref:hypothetical protein n=1 Tax=Streptomyces sp. NPDC101158 TaxID=3366117 RepID=UPI003804237B
MRKPITLALLAPTLAAACLSVLAVGGPTSTSAADDGLSVRADSGWDLIAPVVVEDSGWDQPKP